MTEEMLTQAMLDRPMEYAGMECYLAALADTYALPVLTIGTSVSGRAIRALVLGDPRLRENADKASYAAVYVGGMEDGDWVSTAICLRFLRDYCVFRAEERRLYGVHLPYLWENRTIYVIPCLHPDGMYAAKQSPRLLPRPQTLSLRESFLPGVPLSHTDGTVIPPETAAFCQFCLVTETRLCLHLTTSGENGICTVPHSTARAATIGKLLARMASYPFAACEGKRSPVAWYTEEVHRPAFRIALGRDHSEVGYYYGYAALREVLFSAPLLL